MIYCHKKTPVPAGWPAAQEFSFTHFTDISEICCRAPMRKASEPYRSPGQPDAAENLFYFIVSCQCDTAPLSLSGQKEMALSVRSGEGGFPD